MICEEFSSVSKNTLYVAHIWKSFILVHLYSDTKKTSNVILHFLKKRSYYMLHMNITEICFHIQFVASVDTFTIRDKVLLYDDNESSMVILL